MSVNLGCTLSGVQNIATKFERWYFTIYPKLIGNKFWGSGLWSDGTFFGSVGSVGSVSQETVRRYIDEQKTKRLRPDRFIPAHEGRGFLGHSIYKISALSSSN